MTHIELVHTILKNGVNNYHRYVGRYPKDWIKGHNALYKAVEDALEEIEKLMKQNNFIDHCKQITKEARQ